MKLILLALLLVVGAPVQSAQRLEPVPWQRNSNLVAPLKDGSPDTRASQGPPRRAFVGGSDIIFPHLAAGGGWETDLVLVNMSANPITVTQQFYAQDGGPMEVAMRSVPDGTELSANAVQSTLAPGGSLKIVLYDTGAPLRVGWSSISYDMRLGMVGGYAIFRNRVPEGTEFEALVPLSAYDDTRFLFPFDNLEGYVSSMALVNPAADSGCEVTLAFLDMDGVVMLTDSMTLGPGEQTAFVLRERYPEVSGQVGSVYVQGDMPYLSALGFRFNLKSGAFATVPILNWSGMFYY